MKPLVQVICVATVALIFAGCGAKTTVDYRKADQLEHAVKSQLESEGKSVEQVTCAGAKEVVCVYKLTTGFAAVEYVRVAPDGETWSSG